MVTETKLKKPRPYWHVDMKWIVALILSPVFGVTLLLLNIYFATNRPNAVKISSAITQAMFTQGQTSQDQAVAVREAIRKSPDKILRPFPGTDIGITEADLDKYSLADLKQNLFTSLSETIYDGTVLGLQDQTFKEQMNKLGLMVIFTKTGHDQIGNILLYPIIVTILLLALLIYFSFGFGRFISPALIFILTGLPTLLALTVLKNQPTSAPTTVEMSLQQGIAQFVSSIGPTISEMFMKNYIIILIAGLVLLFTGIIGQIVQRIKNKQILKKG